MPEFTSVILRYRDLSTPVGTTTIAQHQQIIQAKGYVWWGWWHKQGETVPEDAFREILASIEHNGPFNVFLFDSGKDELHHARMQQIVWNNELHLMGTPEREATPDYYGQSHYFAWFKLVAIDDANLPEASLRDYSYVRIDAFFQTKKSIFEAFYGKQVSSFAELRHQDRTIWFIRPKIATDSVHEIHVYDRSRIAPTNFSDQVVQAHSNSLLWVSDPHFSVDHHDFPRSNLAGRRNLSETIRRDLEKLSITSIGGMVISGDLTWRGTQAGFQWAANFIDDVKSWSKLTSSEILVCPGNHDLAFSNEPWVKGSRALDFPKQAKWHEMVIAALGSSGVTPPHRPNEANSYGLLTFNREGVSLTARKISADDATHIGAFDHSESMVYSRGYIPSKEKTRFIRRRRADGSTRQ